MTDDDRQSFPDSYSRQTSIQSQCMSISVSRQGSVIDGTVPDIKLERSYSTLDPGRLEPEGRGLSIDMYFLKTCWLSFS